ncbi:hypothetical protein EET67_18550 [Pseudaminobacter arsenicus]|uniref:Transposase IS66 C-terminal domain-containing protein n=1 Tax=Borborobacter arsenicus TaxID=1851146 RepID=A0A432V2C9_9HYPH|nr:hypothetical protein EET67_18550 [Pseudaminobacter arsenicus]
MFRLGADLKVYLHREPIDFRAGINSLAVLVQETMALDPFAPAVFAFCNRRRDRMLTCRASRVEPLAWLRHALTELPQRNEDADISDLLPFNFAKAAAA